MHNFEGITVRCLQKIQSKASNSKPLFNSNKRNDTVYKDSKH